MARGKVFIIGAGPGDWELITLKGLSRIKNADTILYDFLASERLLDFAKKNAKIICVGKSDGLHIMEQAGINQLLYQEAKEGRRVVRLKGGDPFVFSRGIEEALYLKAKGIDFEIIPGVTSAFAAAESFGIPLTRKGKYSSLAILTGRKSSGEKLDAPKCDTLIYLMAVANLEEVIEALFKAGRDKNEPCALVERATSLNERIVTGKLKNIVERAKKEKVRSPSVFIVGEVVRYGKKIYSYKYK